MPGRLRALFAGIALFASVSAATGAVISIGPYTPSATPFVVPVLVSGAINLDSFAFDVAFDANVFAINTACDPFSDPFCSLFTGPITLGTFYSSTASFPPLFNPGFILLDGTGNQTGSVIGVNAAWQDPAPSPSGDGILAYIEFVALTDQSPSGPIRVVGQPDPPSGGSVPEPPTLALIFSALAGTAFLRRRPGVRVEPVRPRRVA